mmetsp:Transcript_6452/g.18472  ORF Transcript_6452/g.18472 Transcript_6452/m.18472 type:complete len:207 (+) Transcript_6452:128-748(+)
MCTCLCRKAPPQPGPDPDDWESATFDHGPPQGFERPPAVEVEFEKAPPAEILFGQERDSAEVHFEKAPPIEVMCEQERESPEAANMTDVLDLPENNIPSWIQGDVEDKGLQSPSPGQSPLAGQPPTQLSMSTCGDADDAATINSDEPEVPEDWGDDVASEPPQEATRPEPKRRGPHIVWRKAVDVVEPSFVCCLFYRRGIAMPMAH